MNEKRHIPIPAECVRTDIAAGLVVFLVALPLCLGIALASGAPLTSGIIAGAIGGIIVAALSGSPLSVSGPAAGLVVICLDSIKTLGTFEGLLTAVLVAGLIQVTFGWFKLGIIGEYVPSSVVRGMLAGIGLVIVLKQIPHALGRDVDFEGDMKFLQTADHTNSFTSILRALESANFQAVTISVISLLVLFLFDRLNKKRASIVPSQLVVVVLGIAVAALDFVFPEKHRIIRELGHFVNLPALLAGDGLSKMPLPDFSVVTRAGFLEIAITIAVIASIESLLSIEAVDKLDPYRRISPPNKELVAQGVGNILSGAFGGLPITAVILRSSANVYAGGKTKLSGMAHGVFLIGAVLFIPQVLNSIPICALAAILLHLGYKLANPKIFKEIYRSGLDQFLPFIATVLGILFTDLLTGVLLGLSVGLFYVLKLNHHNAVTLVQDGEDTLVRFNKDVSFLNKMELKEALSKIQDGAKVLVDGTKAMYIDRDVYDVIADFERNAFHRGISVSLKNTDGKALSLFRKKR